MMVPTLNDQARIMVECVQNHSVGTMIIDEIGRSTEVNSARTVRQRGVRILASVHGNLRTLLKNAELNELLGGVTTVTVGDRTANMQNPHSKLRTERMSEPAFDVAVELDVDAEGDYIMRVIHNVTESVDAILQGKSVTVQIRKRHAETGALLISSAEI